jgi:hypothetical protein
MFDSKKEAVLDLQLKNQALAVKKTDAAVYDANGGNGKFKIGEKVKEVLCVSFKDDSANDLVHFAAASITISGSNSDDIVVTGLALDTNDVAFIHYVLD